MRIVYIGTGDIGLPTLEWLLTAPGCEVVGVVSQPDKPAGRKMELQPSPIKVRALAAGLPVWQPLKIRAAGALEPLIAAAPDVVVVMAYGQILPKALLDLPRLACLNLHASLLPRHRGAAPVQAAILAGDAESGITVMYMDEGLDTGDILLKHSFPLRRRETGGSLHARLAEAGPLALAPALELLHHGDAPRQPQDHAAATHVPKLSREAGLLRWDEPAAQLERQIRAFNPWPSAYTMLPSADGLAKKLKVFSAIRYRKAAGAPGSVLAADRHGLLVAAGEGALRLREIQLEGKKRMPAGEFLRGYPVAEGTVLTW